MKALHVFLKHRVRGRGSLRIHIYKYVYKYYIYIYIKPYYNIYTTSTLLSLYMFVCVVVARRNQPPHGEGTRTTIL